MPRLSEIPKGESVIMLVYGNAGTGKTEFCGTAGSRAVIIDTGLGIVTLQSPGFKHRHGNNINPLIERVYEPYLPDKVEAHDKVCDLLDKYIPDPEFDTIIIDDATGMKRYAQNKALEVNDDLSKSNTLKEAKKQGVHMMAVQDYGQEMSIIEQLLADNIDTCKKHNKHFILTAHERVEYNKPSRIGEAPTVRMIRPGFTGQTFPDSVTGHFDLVWRFEVQGSGERVLYKARTAGGGSLVAKTRHSGLFPTLVDNPNFLKIVETIKNA